MGSSASSSDGTGLTQATTQADVGPEERIGARIVKNLAVFLQRALRCARLDLRGVDGKFEWHEGVIRILEIDPNLPWEEIEIKITMKPRK